MILSGFPIFYPNFPNVNLFLCFPGKPLILAPKYHIINHRSNKEVQLMNVHQMRAEISKMYPGTWPERVKRMSAKQVIAIYYRFLEQGVFQQRSMYR